MDVVVTGANGFVGARVCRALVERGASVRAVVRRPGSAPALDGLEERVGDFGGSGLRRRGRPRSRRRGDHRAPDGQRPPDPGAGRRSRGRATFATAARDAGAATLVHVSTAAVYDRAPDTGDVGEDADLVDDDAGDYGVTKRDADAALAAIDGITRVLVRPPAILGPGETSVWNTLRPQGMRDDESQRHAVPDATFAWVHVDDLAALIADVATGRIDLPDGCTPVNVAAEPATQRDYFETVAGALGVEPVWDDGPGWTGSIVADRAHALGWTPTVTLAAALREIADGLHPGHVP